MLESICADAAEGLGRFRHGGAEIGGVLYGTKRDSVIRILEYRPLECEYAFGPRFILSDRDRARMRELLRLPQREPALAGLVAVGWYHSHTRSPVGLSPRDLELYTMLFPAEWQIALVVRPDANGDAEAGFFLGADALFIVDVRGRRPLPDGLAPATQEEHPKGDPAAEPGSIAEVPPCSEPYGPDVAPDQAALPPETAALAELEELPAAPPEEPRTAPSDFVPTFGQPASRRNFPAAGEPGEERAPARRWYWAAAAGVLLIAAAAGVWWYWTAARLNVPLSLWVADVGGQLLIEWDRTAGPVLAAQSGVVEIREEGRPKEIKLDPERLKEGSIAYVRRSEIVDVKLRVRLPSGARAEEMIRFVGQPVVRPDVIKERDELKAEVERLQAEVDRLRGGRIRRNALPTTP